MKNVKLRFGDYELDLGNRRLQHFGRAVRVEPRALDVLCHLAVHRDRVVSKRELLETVWPGGFVTEAALSTALYTARLAVGDTGGRQEAIRTRYGRGYQFVAAATPVPSIPSTGDHAGRGSTASLVARRQPTTSSEVMGFCRAEDGVRIAYATSGVGQPLVKTANWLTRLDIDRTIPLWAHWYRDLARGRRLVRYDERGGGMSDWCTPSFSPEVWASDLDAVVDAAGVDRFPLIGTAQGAATAIAYAALRPERVRRMILISTYVRGRRVRARTDLDQKAADVDLDLARIGWQTQDHSFLRALAAQFLPNATAAEWDAFTRYQQQTTSPENVIRFLEGLSRIDAFQLARQVKCPTLIIHSRRDMRVPVSEAVELAALIPGSRLVVLDSGNHLLAPTESAWGELVDCVDEFLCLDATDGIGVEPQLATGVKAK